MMKKKKTRQLPYISYIYGIISDAFFIYRIYKHWMNGRNIQDFTEAMAKC